MVLIWSHFMKVFLYLKRWNLDNKTATGVSTCHITYNITAIALDFMRYFVISCLDWVIWSVWVEDVENIGHFWQLCPNVWWASDFINFTNLDRIYKAHQTNVWWTMEVLCLHWYDVICKILFHVCAEKVCVIVVTIDYYLRMNYNI